MSDAAKMTERMRRPNYGTLEIELTIDDPEDLHEAVHRQPDAEHRARHGARSTSSVSRTRSRTSGCSRSRGTSSSAWRLCQRPKGGHYIRRPRSARCCRRTILRCVDLVEDRQMQIGERRRLAAASMCWPPLQRAVAAADEDRRQRMAVVPVAVATCSSHTGTSSGRAACRRRRESPPACRRTSANRSMCHVWIFTSFSIRLRSLA